MDNMRKFFTKLKLLWELVDRYKEDHYAMWQYVHRVENKINERTTVHADIHPKGASQVIVIGRYRNRDYVRAFTLDGDIGGIIESLHYREKNARVGRFDMPYNVDFSAVYPYENF